MSPPRPPTHRARFKRGGTKSVDRPIHHIQHGVEILETIDQIGFATNEQIFRLFFESRPNRSGAVRQESAARRAAQRALNRLWNAGYVDRRPIMLTSKKTGFGYQSFVSVLIRKGADELQEYFKAQGKGELRWTKRGIKISNKTIEHSLAINDFYVLMRRACEEEDVGFLEWKDDRQLTAMNNAHLLRLVAIPDAFFVLEKNGKFFGHFLEIDLGTETGVGRVSEGVWQQKISAYGRYFRDYYPADGYFRGYTAPIVLTVTSNEERLNDLLRATKKARGAGVYWYTTIQNLFPSGQFDPSALWQPIWRVVNNPLPRSILDRLAR